MHRVEEHGKGLGCDVTVQICLMQGADALERAHRIKTVVFDKTGTLTRGRPVVAAYQLFIGQVNAQRRE